jgi:alcohol dehydrogenase class IV
MLEAAHLSGKAINITRTTAPHALSYAFTSYYNIPHGHAVALTLPLFLEFNYSVREDDCTDPRGADSVRSRIDKILEILNTDIEHGCVRLEEFIGSIGVNLDIAALTDSFDPDIIIDNVNRERLTNNPRLVSKNDILKMLQNQ